jgi:hypothetical protein
VYIDQGQSVAFGDKTVEVVKEFVYSVLVTLNNDVIQEIQRRLQSANRCFLGLRKRLQSGHVSSPTKFFIYEVLIRPVLLHVREEKKTSCL